MVNPSANKKLNKRILRRISRYKLKLLILFLVVFATTGIFVSFFVGTSSVLKSVHEFNKDFAVEDGIFMTENKLPASDDISYEEMKYGEVRYDGKTIRVFSVRENINKHQVTSGEELQEENEILLDKNYLKANGLEIGDTIDLNNRDLTIVGSAISPDYITTKNSDMVLQANSNKFGIAFVDNQTFQSLFGESFSTYYAYSSDLDVQDISEKVEPAYINDSKNNTRIQQVIGDAEAPRDLALLLTCLLYLIVAVLLSVYHFEVSKKESGNLSTFVKLGFRKATLYKHYLTETTVTLFLAWVTGGIAGIGFIDTIKQMNNQIYNYPLLETDYSLLALCLIASFVTVMVLNLILVYRFYIKQRKSTKKRPKSINKSYSNLLKWIPFSYRYRLKRINRNKSEMVLFVLLIFFVGLLINFSFLLKDSVTQYVEDLAIENTFEEVLFLDSSNEVEAEGEEFELYKLYDEEGITQSVYVIGSDSEHYDYGLTLEDGDVIITKAYADKYNKNVGDDITLTDVSNEKQYSFQINKVNASSTVSSIYMVSDSRDLFDDRTYSTPAVALAEQYTDTNDSQIEAKLSRDEIITSGENILNVINKQISLILALAIVLQFTLLYSLLEFSFQNSVTSIRTLKLEGYGLRDLMRMHFSLSIPIALLCIIGSYYISRIAVRIFLDQIMYDFVNFVSVTDSLLIILSSNGMIILIFIFFLLRMRPRLRKL
ncbi:FtsX-like permease family protein [Terribacillus sp. 179-K 1B1 HS]|uniref:FtsX-like permease family protein n=1 Tax=Terribacillus sp. 179-K 1B1 HS TaxID=3142388 RepID=UPI00399F0199